MTNKKTFLCPICGTTDPEGHSITKSILPAGAEVITCKIKTGLMQITFSANPDAAKYNIERIIQDQGIWGGTNVAFYEARQALKEFCKELWDSGNLHTFIGMIGVILVLVAYMVLVAGIWTAESTEYLVANIAGSAYILFSLTRNWNLPAAVVQVMFILIGIWGLIKGMVM